MGVLLGCCCVCLVRVLFCLRRVKSWQRSNNTAQRTCLMLVCRYGNPSKVHRAHLSRLFENKREQESGAACWQRKEEDVGATTHTTARHLFKYIFSLLRLVQRWMDGAKPYRLFSPDEYKGTLCEGLLLLLLKSLKDQDTHKSRASATRGSKGSHFFFVLQSRCCPFSAAQKKLNSPKKKEPQLLRKALYYYNHYSTTPHVFLIECERLHHRSCFVQPRNLLFLVCRLDFPTNIFLNFQKAQPPSLNILDPFFIHVQRRAGQNEWIITQYTFRFPFLLEI